MSSEKGSIYADTRDTINMLIIDSSKVEITHDLSVNGELNIGQDFNIGTDKFIVNSSTGNTSISGTIHCHNNLEVINGVISGNVTVGSGKTLNVSSGLLTLADNQISGDKVEGGTIGSITISQLNGPMNCGSHSMTNVNITSGVIDGINITSGTIDNVNITTSNITVDKAKTLDISDGNLILADDQISGDKVEGGTIDNITISQLAGAMDCNSQTMSNVNITSGTIDNVNIANSDITVGSGKILDISDGTLTLADDQISGDKVEGGTIDNITISQLAGPMDCSNQAMSNVNINGGAIDGTIIGDNSAAAGTFTTLTANTSITGTLATAAQPNITSVGILSNVDINGGAIDGTIIGDNSAAAGTFTTLTVSSNATFNNITSNINYSLNQKTIEKTGYYNIPSGQWSTIATFMQNETTNTWRSAEIIIEETHSPGNGGDKGGGLWIGNFTYIFHNEGGRTVSIGSISRISGHGGSITFKFVALSNNNASSGARLEVYNYRGSTNYMAYKFRFHSLDAFQLS